MRVVSTARRNGYRLVVVLALLLAVGQAFLASTPALASPGAPPSNVPAALAVPAGYSLLFSSHAVGVQIYVCQSGQWAFHAPRAKLFDAEYGRKTATHYGGIDRNFTAGPWWEAARDTSRIRGGNALSAPSPNPDSIPLLRLEVLEHGGSGVFDSVAYVQRLNTTGGVVPTGECRGHRQRKVPYTADYYFYGN